MMDAPILAMSETFRVTRGISAAVVSETLPATARETHVSLFDGSNPGFELTDRPAFSVQYHPEASPQESLYLFEKFVSRIARRS